MNLPLFTIAGLALTGAVAASDPTPRSLDLFTLAIEKGAPLFDGGEREACLAIYEIAARAAIDLDASLFPEERETLARALAVKGEAGERAWALRRAFDAIRDLRVGDATFEVVDQAALPEGFPAPGALGRVVLKTYPRYRAARTEGEGFAFNRLFNHITDEGIAMTAPVEMGMEEDDGGFTMKSMAFLYASPELGRAGEDGGVEVVDLEAQRVLSIGLRGPLSPEKLLLARGALARRAAEEKLRTAGWRVLGYNSPMVPEGDRFYELQVTVGAE